MSGSKHFEKVAWSVTVVMLLVTCLFMNGAALGVESVGRSMGYENRLFDNTKVHTLDIVMDDWEDLIANAASETYYAANVVIDGEAYKNVGLRTKGNTSLSTVSTLGSERYSFKIEFDHYESAKSYYGLDKLSLNNLIQDSTMMKDYLTYTMMNEFGADTPLCSFVYITVNGEDWGLYLAVEGIEEAFLERNYGSDYGNLYKPDSLSFGGGRGNGANFDMNNLDFSSFSAGDAEGGFPNGNPLMENVSLPSETDEKPLSGTDGKLPEDFDFSAMFDSFNPAEMFGDQNKDGGFGGGGMGSSDVKLQYIDDDIDSYSNIWNNAKTDITEADQNRLIASLKKLSAGEDVDSVVNVEQVIRYFVVHNYVCNDDSYTGTMVHNYYLYEKDGQLTMLPWDYNLGYGTFSGGNASSTVNTPIDSPVTGSSSDRPMWSWILADDAYTELYHAYFADFLNTVDIQKIIDDAYELIQPYVQKDPTAFYTGEEFETGVETLRQFCSLRSASISMQLENGETVSQMNYADASAVTLSDMGSMNMGGGQGGGQGGPGGREDFGSMPDDFDFSDLPENIGGEMPEDFDFSNPPERPDGDMPGNFSEQPEKPEGEIPENGVEPPDKDASSSASETSEAEIPEQSAESQPDGDSSEPPEQPNEGNSPGNNDVPSRDTPQMPDEMNGWNPGERNNPTSDWSGWIWIAASVLVLGIGLVVAKAYRY